MVDFFVYLLQKYYLSAQYSRKKHHKIGANNLFSQKILQIQKKFLPLHSKSRDRAVVARQAHNLKVGGSTPSPATKHGSSEFLSFLFLCRYSIST